MVRDRLLDRHPLLCDVCAKVIEPGELALSNDGYARVSGEFLLADTEDLHEDNHPMAHADCGT